MPAGIAADSISVELLVQLALTNLIVNYVAKRRHGIPLGLF
jgi:hypothetical protein